MGRKVFISILGTSFYRKSVYERETPAFKAKETRFIQLATLELLKAEKWDKENSLIVIGLTEGARTTNWNLSTAEKPNQRIVPNPNKEIKEWEEYIGLKEELQSQFPNIPVAECSIPDGKNEDEIMEIFSRLFSFIKEGDELHFDLTHGFRYLPMLVTVLANYSRFIYPEVTIEHMSYGNFEMKNKNGNCTFIDLLPLHTLQEWTFAAANYLENGYTKKLVELSQNNAETFIKDSNNSKSKDTLKGFFNNLNDFVNDMLHCRGMNIIGSTTIGHLKESSKELLSIQLQEASKALLEKVEKSLEDFDCNKNVLNGIAASRWCLNNNLYQQSITILEETVISLICEENGLAIDNPNERDLVGMAFSITMYEIPEEKWGIKQSLPDEKKEVYRNLLKKLLSSPRIEQFMGSFIVFFQIRNDFNHAGMRQNPSTSDKLREQIEGRINKIENELKEHPYANKPI